MSGKQESASGGGLAGAGESGIADAVGEYGDLNVVLAGTVRHADFLVMSALHFGSES